MKLKKWLDNLNAQVKNNPKLLEVELITSKDDEGNGYSAVIFTANIGSYDGEDFYPIEDERFENSYKVICLN